MAPAPGIISSSLPIEPIFLSWRIWARKSFRSRPCLVLSFSSHPLGLADIQGLLHLLDEADHVAHAQDARGHAVGMERLQVLRPLARADAQDRDSR